MACADSQSGSGACSNGCNCGDDMSSQDLARLARWFESGNSDWLADVFSCQCKAVRLVDLIKSKGLLESPRNLRVVEAQVRKNLPAGLKYLIQGNEGLAVSGSLARSVDMWGAEYAYEEFGSIYRIWSQRDRLSREVHGALRQVLLGNNLSMSEWADLLSRLSWKGSVESINARDVDEAIASDRELTSSMEIHKCTSFRNTTGRDPETYRRCSLSDESQKYLRTVGIYDKVQTELEELCEDEACKGEIVKHKEGDRLGIKCGFDFKRYTQPGRFTAPPKEKLECWCYCQDGSLPEDTAKPGYDTVETYLTIGAVVGGVVLAGFLLWLAAPAVIAIAARALPRGPSPVIPRPPVQPTQPLPFYTPPRGPVVPRPPTPIASPRTGMPVGGGR